MKIRENWSERGQALILIVGALVGLLAFTALAVDGGMVLYDRRSAQNAADAAALAGAYTLSWNYYTATNQAALESAVDSAIHTRAHDNHYDTADGKSVAIGIYNVGGDYSFGAPPASIHTVQADSGDPNYYVQVTITSPVNTSFLHLIYSGTVENTVTAVAHAVPQPKGPPAGGSALVSLAPTGCATASGSGGGIYIGGNGLANLIGGGLFINSNSDCALSGASNGYLMYSPNLTDVGGIDSSVGSNLIIQPGPSSTNDTNAALTYPPVLDMGGTPSCSGDASLNATDATNMTHTAADGTSADYDYIMTPGWVGTGHTVGWAQFPKNKNVWFKPGIYCFNTSNTGGGNINFSNGEILGGNNVLFYLTGVAPCTFTWNGGATIKLQGYYPGTEDPHSGILIYVDPKGYPLVSGSYIQGTFNINGSLGSFIQGTVFAPTCSATLNGNGGNMYQGQYLAYNITLSGNNTFFLDYNVDLNYQQQQPVDVDLSQ